VEKPDVIGLDHLWSVALHCPNDQVAQKAVDLIIGLNLNGSAKNRQKETPQMHKKFLAECYRRLLGQ